MTDPRAEALEVIDRLVGADALRVPGWATVELERAARDLGSGTAVQVRDLPDDPLLGARCRVLAAEKGGAILLLEPTTEGRIAASLARYGEGYVATWIRLASDRYDNLVGSARREGLRLSSEAAGPFGRERLVLGGPAWGPHVLVAELGPASPVPGAATIEP
jgi:hypothetical protein